MEKITFENTPSTKTPINANNLNKMQNNMETAINNACGNLIKFNEVELIFDVSNATTGDFVIANSNNTIPSISGMTVVGIIPNTVSYGNKNYFTSLNLRDNKVYGQIRLEYKGSETSLKGWAYIIYVNSTFVEDGVVA